MVRLRPAARNTSGFRRGAPNRMAFRSASSDICSACRRSRGPPVTDMACLIRRSRSRRAACPAFLFAVLRLCFVLIEAALGATGHRTPAHRRSA